MSEPIDDKKLYIDFIKIVLVIVAIVALKIITDIMIPA
jgi:hypothetical protein